MGSIDEVKRQNQVLFLTLRFYRAFLINLDYRKFEIHLRLWARGRSDNHEIYHEIANGEEATYEIECSDGQETCSSEIVLFIPFLRYNTYDAFIEFTNLSQELKSETESIEFEVNLLSEVYSSQWSASGLQ